ncbi:hypothetical protein RB195_021809 [Necator americanus]|uniref:Uncharacterized protein n=1 Tax=Necator americanus TaxID=51031 RepID=A0ABR1EFD7_NECAM
MSDVSNSFSAWETLPEDEPPLCIAIRRPVSPPRHYEAIRFENRCIHMFRRIRPAFVLRLGDAGCYQNDVISKSQMVQLLTINLHSYVVPFQPPHCVLETGREYFS